MDAQKIKNGPILSNYIKSVVGLTSAIILFEILAPEYLDILIPITPMSYGKFLTYVIAGAGLMYSGYFIFVLYIEGAYFVLRKIYTYYTQKCNQEDQSARARVYLAWSLLSMGLLVSGLVIIAGYIMGEIDEEIRKEVEIWVQWFGCTPYEI